MNEETLFELALNTPENERSALLDRACAGNPELRARVEALLRADAGGTAAWLPPQPNRAAAGAVIAGRYKLLERIGEGGMGDVWVAEQTEPVRRKVALKLIKAGMDSKSVLARFEAERQALAVMDHPNIAKVLDGGLTDTGRPYFVMEYVKGVPITEYCDATRLSVPERLNLFVQVCQAVQHAHQKGIIHRDLKPSNILVAPYDDRPVPKVIDFGLAKAMHQSLTERTLHTAHETVLGTPLYMSPEQAQLNNLDVDTRSDIYSLGVLLYELLTGTTPLEKQRFKEAAWDEIKRIIREEEPPRPSTRLSSSNTLPSLAASRQMEPARLTTLVRGELDWIVMKSLEKDRSRRYETANGFAADVQRYLAGEPVLAAPPSATYRLKKFLRRNKGPVSAAALVVVALLTGIAGTSFGLVRAIHAAETQRLANLEIQKAAEAERLAKFDAVQQKEKAIQAAVREAEERKKAEAASIEAKAKEAEANAVVKFFENQVFAAGRPKGEAGGLGHDVSLRDAIRASLPALGKSFEDQPLVEARLRLTLGNTFGFLGEHARAAEQLERARDLFTRHHGPDHQSTIASMGNLANNYADLKRHTDALKLRVEVLAACRRLFPADHPNRLASMGALANSYAALNRHTEALKLYEVVLDAEKRVLPPDHESTLLTMNNLAESYAVLNRHAEALKLREAVLAAHERMLPADHPRRLICMMNLAITYADQNRHKEALKLFEEAFAAQKRVLPTDHPDTLMTMNNLAMCYRALNRHAEALKLCEDTLAARKRVLRPDHPDTLTSMNNLSMCYTDLNRHVEALKLCEQTLAAQKRVLPPDDPDTLTSMHRLANCYEVLNRHTDALKLREQTLSARKRVLPPDHVDILRSMNNLAVSFSTLNRHTDALKLHQETLAAQRRVMPPDHAETLWSLCNVAATLIKLDRDAEAIPFIEECFSKAAGKAVPPKLIPRLISLRVRCFQKVRDVAGCRTSVEMLEKLNPTDWFSLYNVACYRAVTAALQAKAKEPDAARLAKEDADKAMSWLNKAVAAGFENTAHIRKDTDLDFLRDREDFKKLIAELEKKAEKK